MSAASDSGSSGDWTSSALTGALKLGGAIASFAASTADWTATRIWAGPAASLKVARADDDIVIPIYRTNWASISQHRLLCFSTSFFYRVNPQGGKGDVRAVFSYSNVKRLDVDTRERKLSIHFFDGAATENLQCARLEELVNLLVERCNALRPAVSVHFEKGSTPFAVGSAPPAAGRWQPHPPSPSPSDGAWLPSEPARTPSSASPLPIPGWPDAVPRSAAAPIPRRVSCSPPDLTPPASWAGSPSTGLAAALARETEAQEGRAFSPVDLSPRAARTASQPVPAPPGPDIGALHACLAQLHPPRTAPFKQEDPQPSSTEEESSLRGGTAFSALDDELEEEAAPPPLSKAARRRRKKTGQ